MDQIARLQEKLADPITGAALATFTAEGISFANGRSYEVAPGAIPVLLPSEADCIDYYGRRDFTHWRQLQDVAESSYDVRTEGHFSVNSYQPGIDYGNVLRTLPAGEFLDVGCGGLELPSYMEQAPAHRYYGLDPYLGKVTRAFPFVVGCGDFLPFRDASFDGVLFSSSLDHTINPRRALEEAARILRPGGLVVVWETMRDPKRIAKWAQSAVYFQTQFNKHHHWCFDQASLEFIVKETGFDPVSWHTTSEPTEAIFVARKKA